MKLVFLVAILLLVPGIAPGAETCAQPSYKIVVDFSDIALHLFDGEKLVASYPVALPRVTPCLPITGTVVRVIRDPVWYPTESTRKYYFKKKGVELPKRIEPGSKMNAMGSAKIVIDFDSDEINDVTRVHGTNDPPSIGKRVSRGCIRMLNKDILALADIITGTNTKVAFTR